MEIYYMSFKSQQQQKVRRDRVATLRKQRSQRAWSLLSTSSANFDDSSMARTNNVVSIEIARQSPKSEFAQNLLATPAELLKRNTPLFCLRIVLASFIILAASTLMMAGSPLLFAIGLLMQGAMYVHLIELQHSVLHLHAFSSHRVNRLVGIMLGLPMLISFSDFQYRHLRHHKYLGTAFNTETFSYQHSRLNSLSGFIKGMFDYSRCQTIIKRILLAYSHQPISDGQNLLMETRIRQEYQLFGVVLAAMLLVCGLIHSAWPLLLWLAPLVAAEPIHFLLELPEHFALKAHSNPNVFENTRSWGGSWFARWYSHNTNYHLAHHFNQLVPMHRLPELQKTLEWHIPESSKSKSYPDFFLQVVRGELKAEDGD